MVGSFQNDTQNSPSPLVTVAMPIYNAGDYLRFAVLSIVKQTFQNWELLIIDDGSTDNAFLNIADIKDPRIRILRDGSNKGLASRLNECIDLSRGKYFARMDGDDVSYPERLMRQVMWFEENCGFDLVAVRAITIDENNEITGLFPSAVTHNEICAKPWQGFYFPHPTWMGKIEWFRKYRYAIPAHYFCEDQELLLRSYRDSTFGTVDEALFAYRVRGKVNQKKLSKTRRAVLNFQFPHFSSLNQWHFVFLATAAFVAKRSVDSVKRAGIGTSQSVRHIADAAVTSNWNNVLDCLAVEAKVP